MTGLGARIAASQGLNKEQESRLQSTITLWEQLAPGERPAAVNYLELGNAHRKQGHLRKAIGAYRSAIRLIRSRRGSARFDQLLPYFKTALELAHTYPAEATELHKQMFEAAQLVRSGRTAQDIARAAARLAAVEGRAGEVVRVLQEAEDERYALYRDYEAKMARAQ